MSFYQDQVKTTYSSDEASLLDDFYIPVLTQANKYDRAVGFFSATMLTYALQGLDGFIRNNGKMRLIIGEEVTDDEYDAIKSGSGLSAVMDRADVKWRAILENTANDLFYHRLKILSWLVANKHLEIKYALRHKGMYHEKIGIMRDNDGNTIVFQGSANETTYALLPDFNFESISVYPSWKAEVFNDYAKPYIQRFEKLWLNQSNNTLVVDIPSQQYDRIREFYNQPQRPDAIEKELYDSLFLTKDLDIKPSLPKVLGGKPYQLYDHQKEALNSWKANNFNGVMSLATGAGKTITAIHAAVVIANSSTNTKLAIVVAVPYQILGDQWCDVFSLFNITPIQCYRSKSLWLPSLEKEIADFNALPSKKFMAVVVVNATLTKTDFQSQLNKINPEKLFFIGDECHHHGKNNWIPKLPDARFRMGLSATPWSIREDERKNLLTSYYGQEVAKYSIDKAISDEVLTPYQYHMHLVYLNDNEAERYEELTASINKMIAIRESGGAINHDQLTMLFMSRSRLLGSMEDKFNKLSEILNGLAITPHTLFYCGDGSTEMDDYEDNRRDIERVAQLLDQNGWKTSRFTADETTTVRHRILDNFKEGIIDGVVAIRVLDEGFDVPACRTAFLLASSRNERQFIQRRGRILRKSVGKEYAVIHDFIVLPPDHIHNEVYQSLVEKELARAGEFIRVAMNKKRMELSAQSIGEEYGVDFEAVEYTYVNWES